MIKRAKIVALMVFLGSLCALWGCAGETTKSAYIKEGKEYGKVQGTFRHRWWNYYERGLSFTEGAFYQEAVVDLNEALKQRGKDQRMARTYGMHFIDYFPHRELGIVYYQMGKLEEARSELEISLGQFPSAKARFYLDRVRKALIEKEGSKITPPNLSLVFKEHEVWTREDPVTISGMAEDDHYISQISFNNRPLLIEGSRKSVSFEESLQLTQGRHVIEVVAENLLGKVTRRQIVIHVDREGPMITLEELKFNQEDQGKGYTIQGSIFDEAGVSQLSINGRSIAIQEGMEVFFTENMTILRGALVLEAYDRLGNRTSANIPMRTGFLEQGPKHGKRSSLGSPGYPPVRIASADVNENWIPAFAGMTEKGRWRRYESAGAGMIGRGTWDREEADRRPYSRHVMVGRLFGSKDNRPPVIRLRGWTDTQTVFLEKVYIEGDVRDESKIESLTVNQTQILRRKGEGIFFSHLADLNAGENHVVIEAVDEAGNRTTKKITVIRKIPKALQLAERLSLTVLPFEQKEVLSGASLSFQDNLIDSLVNRNRFSVVERDKLDIVLREQKLSRTALIDKDTALKIGKLIAAESIITGSIIETREGIEIVGRMIDTETSEILATEDVFDEAKDIPALMSLAEGMALKFHRDFPLLDGLIIQQKGKDIFTDLGQNKIKVRRKLIVYREEPIKHPVTGKILGADNMILGRARVTQVMSEMSKAEIMDGEADTIGLTDKVITE